MSTIADDIWTILRELAHRETLMDIVIVGGLMFSRLMSLYTTQEIYLDRLARIYAVFRHGIGITVVTDSSLMN